MKTILHIINAGQSASKLRDGPLELISDTDAILFIENGVYNVVSTRGNKSLLCEIRAKIYVLTLDLQARGFGEQDIMDHVKAIDYDGFVDLTAQFDSSISW